MKAVVTRPRAQAQVWVAALAEQGVDAWACPLIEIRAVASGAQQEHLSQCLNRIGSYNAVMFVSGAAAEHFLAARPEAAAQLQTAWAPGPSTAQTLASLGVAAHKLRTVATDATSWDSEALWAQVCPSVGVGFSLLIVRGADATSGDATNPAGHGRDWLTEQVMQAGGQVSNVAAYERDMPHWSASDRARALAAIDQGHTWLFSSSQSINHLEALLPGRPWVGSKCTAVATHARIAQRAASAGFSGVHLCAPSIDAVAQALRAGEHPATHAHAWPIKSSP